MNKKGFQLHGQAMKMIRLNFGKSAVEVSHALGVSKEFISMCEKNKRKLSVARTKSFLDFLGVSEDEAKTFSQIVGNQTNEGGE